MDEEYYKQERIKTFSSILWLKVGVIQSFKPYVYYSNNNINICHYVHCINRVGNERINNPFNYKLIFPIGWQKNIFVDIKGIVSLCFQSEFRITSIYYTSYSHLSVGTLQ